MKMALSLSVAVLLIGCKTETESRRTQSTPDYREQTHTLSQSSSSFANAQEKSNVSQKEFESTSSQAIAALADDLNMTSSSLEVRTVENSDFDVSGTYYNRSMALTGTAADTGVYQGPFGTYKRRRAVSREDGSGYVSGAAVGPYGNRGAAGAVGKTPAGNEWAIGIAASPFGVCAGGAARNASHAQVAARGCCASWTGQVKCSGF